jgi:hypothetical protein
VGDSGTSIVLNALCAKGRQLRNGPTAAKSFDEEKTRIHTPPENVDGIPFICEFDRFGGDDLQVGIDPTLITMRKKMQRIFRRCDRLILLLCFGLENAQCGEVVLDFLE